MPPTRGFVDLRARKLNHTSANARIIREKTCEFIVLVFGAATQMPFSYATVLIYHRGAAHMLLAQGFVDLRAPKPNHAGPNARIIREMQQYLS